MERKYIILMCAVILIVVGSFIFINKKEEKGKNESTNTINATIIGKDDGLVTIETSDNIIYTLNYNNNDIELGNNVAIEYTGLLNQNTTIQDISVLNFKLLETVLSDEIPDDWQDNGIFKQNYKLAYQKLKTLSLDEKIGQLLLVRYNEDKAIEDLKKYNFGGFVFFEKDFVSKTEQDVKDMIGSVQKNSKIPLLTAVDEEGGKIVRISSNSALVSEKFKASSELYTTGGLPLIKEDTINKSKVLNNLGLNLNLAPVVDVSTNSSDYIYDRTLKQNTDITASYAKTVIEASKNTGVSYTLKHFPGYGNNSDTHQGSSLDNKSLDDIKKNDLPPFRSGIEAGAEAVLVSHNTVKAIDSSNPASLSTGVHNLLRNDLGFTGIVITDDISMKALDSISNTTVNALLAGNDIVITTDYVKSFNEIKDAINNKTLSESLVDKLAFRVLSWKYYKNLITDTK